MIGDFFKFDKKKDSSNSKEEIKDIGNADETTTPKSEYVDEDPVEKMFNFFFGEKEEKPMGLARFGSERFPGKFY